MGVKERILTIRLAEKAERNPAYAKRIGITVPHAAATEISKSAGRRP